MSGPVCGSRAQGIGLHVAFSCNTEGEGRTRTVLPETGRVPVSQQSLQRNAQKGQVSERENVLSWLGTGGGKDLVTI